MEAFRHDLMALINKHSLENVADVPDFILAEMICRMIEAVGPSIKKTLDWHRCNSVCHPSPESNPSAAFDCRRCKACGHPLPGAGTTAQPSAGVGIWVRRVPDGPLCGPYCCGDCASNHNQEKRP